MIRDKFKEIVDKLKKEGKVHTLSIEETQEFEKRMIEATKNSHRDAMRKLALSELYAKDLYLD